MTMTEHEARTGDKTMHGDSQAFPFHFIDPEGRYGQEVQTGMTKREAFAMAAMQGFLASNRLCEAEISDARHDELIAQWSVEVADALLAKLAKEPQA